MEAEVQDSRARVGLCLEVGMSMRKELTYAALSIHLHWVQNWIVTRGSLGSAASCLGSAIGSWSQDRRIISCLTRV